MTDEEFKGLKSGDWITLIGEDGDVVRGRWIGISDGKAIFRPEGRTSERFVDVNLIRFSMKGRWRRVLNPLEPMPDREGP